MSVPDRTIFIDGLSMASLIGGRTEQQDRIAAVTRVADGAVLLALADGMGGMDRGGEAATILMETLLADWLSADPAVPVDRVLEDALLHAHVRITRFAAPGRPCGTTAAVAVIRGRQLWHAHVGDSRVHVARRGRLILRTRDHSLVESYLVAGRLTPKQTFRHPRSNQLLQCLGGSRMPEVALGAVDLLPGDLISLMTDGVWGSWPEDGAALAVPALPGPDTAARLALAGIAGGGAEPDNATVLVARVPGLAPLNRPGMEVTGFPSHGWFYWCRRRSAPV